jgi:UDP-galactose transporter B1
MRLLRAHLFDAYRCEQSKGGGASSSALGFIFLLGSLVCDGVTGGAQNNLKEKARKKGLKAKPYDMMLWTNFYMMLYMILAAVLTGEFFTAFTWTMANPSVLKDILYFSLCSAVGQSFIFYVVSVFDPLVCTTITTTRKIGSVLSSILIYGHSMSFQRWFGVAIATIGILGELESKFRPKSKRISHAKVAHAA